MVPSQRRHSYRRVCGCIYHVIHHAQVSRSASVTHVGVRCAARHSELVPAQCSWHQLAGSMCSRVVSFRGQTPVAPHLQSNLPRSPTAPHAAARLRHSRHQHPGEACCPGCTTWLHPPAVKLTTNQRSPMTRTCLVAAKCSSAARCKHTCYCPRPRASAVHPESPDLVHVQQWCCAQVPDT